jgi:hypothetical protein
MRVFSSKLLVGTMPSPLQELLHVAAIHRPSDFLRAVGCVQQGQSGKLFEAFGRHGKADVETLLGKPTDCSARWACPVAPGATKTALSACSTPVTKC